MIWSKEIEFKEIIEERDNLRKTAQIRWAALQDEKRKNASLRAENDVLKSDLAEYREILCNKHKQLDAIVADNDALRKQVEHMRGYIASLDVQKKNAKMVNIS